MTTGEPTAKVMIRTVDDSGEVDVETLWAVDLGDDIYELANSPFYAYSVSWEDRVYAPYDEDEKFPVLARVIEKSGNRTVRVMFDPPVEDGNESDRVLQGLVALGCSYEGANFALIAINIPVTVDLVVIRNYLIEQDANWEHADPTYDELFPDDE